MNQKKYQSGSHTCSGWRRRNEKKRKERSNQDRRRTSSWWTYAPGNEALAKDSEEAPPSGLPGCVPDADCRPTSPRWLGRQAEQPGYAQGRTPTVKMRQFPVAQREPAGSWADASEATGVAEGRQGSEIEDDFRRQMAKISNEKRKTGARAARTERRKVGRSKQGRDSTRAETTTELRATEVRQTLYMRCAFMRKVENSMKCNHVEKYLRP